MDQINRALRRLPTQAVYALCLVPAALLLAQLLTGDLGPDPVKTIELDLGIWALRILIASLVITPLRWAGINALRFRRALGLMAFFYATLHLTAWAVLDMGLLWDQMLRDLTRRWYIIVGMVGLLAMLPLAITSNSASIRMMGGRAWARLHKLAYLALLAGGVHFSMVYKTWRPETVIYLAIIGTLLGLRLLRALPRPKWALAAR
ncbi:MAG: protein-methionine-sulfoxide reductase heme-binding subunit MsrQ [Rhodobacteraceae bacterium]|nr:protein-methionine-sulfoxide reductase heme-binding subunit MsrQ [Paracoccaceae bacterium]